MADLFIISKEFAFEAAHHLPQMPDDHQCKRQHGHSYRVIVELRSEKLNDDGFVRDFGELDVIKRYIDEKLDHRDLAELVGGENTTAERLAAQLFHAWRKMLPELYSVTVCETAKTRATYMPNRDADELLAILKRKALEQFGDASRWQELS